VGDIREGKDPPSNGNVVGKNIRKPMGHFPLVLGEMPFKMNLFHTLFYKKIDFRPANGEKYRF